MNITKYLIILGIAFILNSCGDPYKVLYGRWQIYKYEGGHIVGLTDEEASQLIGKEFLFNKEYVIIDKNKIDKPIYKFRKEKADSYFHAGYRIPKEFIGIYQDTIKILEISTFKPSSLPPDFFEHEPKDMLSFYISELILYKGELIFNIEGIFFYLKKVK
ncbi:hypothetical protein [Candidatus Amoebophilus asiaticus]|uniref:hypothetical protein n=1 Tax=Candidatus Amoebophilus asiaticus TaxID=281120 RepID=UPI0001714DE1|nr:hypothetical protein [Candidatus Amoebophilus asiaticus]